MINPILFEEEAYTLMIEIVQRNIIRNNIDTVKIFNEIRNLKIKKDLKYVIFLNFGRFLQFRNLNQRGLIKLESTREVGEEV